MTMYVSILLVDTGSNPDRPRPGRLWLRNLYRVHQRLCMAFPSSARKQEDPDFIRPYAPQDFSTATDAGASTVTQYGNSSKKNIHVRRNNDQGFLFRVEPHTEVASAVIIVQSAIYPDWEYAFKNAAILLSARPEVKSFEPQLADNQLKRFHILANPVRKVSHKSLDAYGNPFDKRWIGKDVPVPDAELPRWLERRAEPGWLPPGNSLHSQPPPGFQLIRIFDIQPGYVYVNRSLEARHGRNIRSAWYEGILKITDTGNFFNTITKGIGPSKAFGFGLLSMADYSGPDGLP